MYLALNGESGIGGCSGYCLNCELPDYGIETEEFVKDGLKHEDFSKSELQVTHEEP